VRFLDHGLLVQYVIAKSDCGIPVKRIKLPKRLELGIFGYVSVYYIGVVKVLVYLYNVIYFNACTAEKIASTTVAAVRTLLKSCC